MKYRCQCGNLICTSCYEQSADICDQCNTPIPSNWLPPKGDAAQPTAAHPTDTTTTNAPEDDYGA